MTDNRIRTYSQIREWAFFNPDDYSGKWVVLELDEDGNRVVVDALADGDKAKALAEAVDGVMVWCSYNYED